jgi:hypothetical protein
VAAFLDESPRAWCVPRQDVGDFPFANPGDRIVAARAPEQNTGPPAQSRVGTEDVCLRGALVDNDKRRA